MSENNVVLEASEWLGEFASALAEESQERLAGLFAADAEWRDVVAFTWDWSVATGAATIAESLLRLNREVRMTGIEIDTEKTSPSLVLRAGEQVIEAIYRFETASGSGSGVIRLLRAENAPARARLISTTLQELHGHPERRGANRPKGTDYTKTFGGGNWLDKRGEEQRFESRQPEVVVVGGGQAGLTIAARLRTLGVDVLILEKLPRVGDVWRQRYHSLTLHNETWVASFPYLEFPDSWPTFLPKDKLAGWMEYYADAMELNVWTNSTLTGGAYDELTQTWDLTVSKDGEPITLRPKHVVFGTGSVSGKPFVPNTPGLDGFGGEVIHSSRYTSEASYLGKRALVVGTGTSGHDVAQDLHARGASVTIVQRNPTTVVSIEPSGLLVYALYSQGLPLEDADLIATANTYQTLIRSNQLMAQQMLAWDADILDRLRAVGFKTDIGEDGTGFHLKYNRRGGGYYINVGCSELIADGDIALLHNDDIERFTERGIRLRNGEEQDYDFVVFATGYSNQQEDIRGFFGDGVADRIGRVWGVGEDGEMQNMWRPTAQPGLWFHGGSLAACRMNSKYLALQIKADLEGMNPRTSRTLDSAATTVGSTT